MSAPDELAKLLFRHGVSDGGGRAADAILAAGYSKPRTITTVEELHALPKRSIIRDKYGALECFPSQAGSNVWFGSSKESLGVCLPATVLYTPKES